MRKVVQLEILQILNKIAGAEGREESGLYKAIFSFVSPTQNPDNAEYATGTTSAMRELHNLIHLIKALEMTRQRDGCVD